MSDAPVAVDLDVLGDTRPLWHDWLASAAGVLGMTADALPRDRAEAAAVLDEAGGNWEALLARFCEDRAPAYLRRDAATSEGLRALASSGRRVGVFTDAPAPLARIALAQLGGDRRVTAVETGRGAAERLLATLGTDAIVVRTRDELLDAAAARPRT